MSKPKWSSRRRREQSWVLLLLAVALAVLAAVVNQWKEGPSWLIVVLAVLAGVGGVLLVRLKEDAKARDTRTGLLENAMLTTRDRVGRLPTVAGTALTAFGVHEAVESIPYLHRDVERKLLHVLESGSPALVLGSSMAGKTRMAAEVMRSHYAERMLVIPDVPDGLYQLLTGGEMPGQAVIWLDHLELYIADPKNLKGRWLDELTEAGNIVIATMSESDYEGFLSRTQWGLLGSFHTVRLLDDEDERQRLAEESGDARIGAGISRYGVGAYIGGGFLAKERWETGKSQHPLGAALVQAAVDWRRIGIGEAIPESIAQSLAPAYLTGIQLDAGVEDLSKAISWATDRDTGAGAFRLLSPVNGGWRPFDYLLDHIRSRVERIPDQTWEAVARADAPSLNLVSAGVTAAEGDQKIVAERLFTRAAGLDSTDAMINLGVLLTARGETKQAERFYRRAADLGSTDAMINLSGCLAVRGETEQAEALLLKAAGLGNTDAVLYLAIEFKERGEMEQAEELFRQAVCLGNVAAMYYLGPLLEQRGETEQAEQLWEQVEANRDKVDARDKIARSDLGLQLKGRGETEAWPLYRPENDLGLLDVISGLPNPSFSSRPVRPPKIRYPYFRDLVARMLGK